MIDQSEGGFASRWRLVALCSGTAAVEAVVLLALGVQSGLALAPQVSAPAPLGLFHDLRWLIVYQDSWWSFGLELAGVLVLRTLFTASCVRAAWPCELAVPSWRQLLRRCASITVLAAVLLAPWTIILFGLAVVSVSWLFFAAVPSVVVISLLLSHGAVSADWWRRAPAPRAIGWLALSFAAASIAAAVISLDPDALVVPVAALAGLFNAFTWFRLVRAVTLRRPTAAFRPVAPAAIIAFLAVVVAGTSIGFAAVARPAGPPRGNTGGAAAARSAAASQAGPGGRSQAQPVLIASGFWSSWDGASRPPLQGDFLETHFSYRGLARDGEPLPYTSAYTEQPLSVLDRLMSAQVEALYRVTHRKVSIVAESEGSLVAKTYLESVRRAPVSSLVLVSPLVTPGRVYYPPQGGSGWGVAAGLGLRGVSDTVSTMTSVDLAPDKPFMRSIVENAPALQTVLDCPLPGVRQYAVMPLADAVAAPTTASLGIPTTVVPAFHGGLLGDGYAQRTIEDILDGSSPGPSTWAAFEDLIRPLADAWQVPDLSPALNTAWDLPSGKPAPDGSLPCSRIRSLLAGNLARG